MEREGAEASVGKGIQTVRDWKVGFFPEFDPLSGCTNPAHSGRSSKTHQSTEGHERLRGPAGEWAAGERARCSQPLAPDRGARRGEHGGSPGQDPEGPKLNGSCGHHQPERKVKSESERILGETDEGKVTGCRQERGRRSTEWGQGAPATHPGRGRQPQCDCGQQGHCRQSERGQRSLLQPQPLAQERLPWGAG